MLCITQSEIKIGEDVNFTTGQKSNYIPYQTEQHVHLH